MNGATPDRPLMPWRSYPLVYRRRARRWMLDHPRTCTIIMAATIPAWCVPLLLLSLGRIGYTALIDWSNY